MYAFDDRIIGGLNVGYSYLMRDGG
jgi:hypothetical protein